jgi:hypothetical protein
LDSQCYLPPLRSRSIKRDGVLPATVISRKAEKNDLSHVRRCADRYRCRSSSLSQHGSVQYTVRAWQKAISFRVIAAVPSVCLAEKEGEILREKTKGVSSR